VTSPGSMTRWRADEVPRRCGNGGLGETVGVQHGVLTERNQSHGPVKQDRLGGAEVFPD